MHSQKHTCEETLRDIERFIDGEVETSIRIEIEEHLSDCPPCLQRAEFQRHVKVLISHKCVESHVPDEIATKILRMIRELDPAE